MKQFCEEVLKFLRSEYNDSYRFDIECHVTVPADISSCHEYAKLTVTVTPGYKLVIVNASMQWLFSLYMTGDFIEERKQFRWQKELIDMIEGG